MLYVLIPVYVVVCVFLVLVVLLQQGKGADVASAFGASSSQTTFGARGATTVFEKVTTWSFVAFAVLAITISIVESRRGKGTVMGGLDAPKKAAVPAPVTPGMPAPATQGAAPAPATGAAPAPATGAAPAPAAPSK